MKSALVGLFAVPMLLAGMPDASAEVPADIMISHNGVTVLQNGTAYAESSADSHAEAIGKDAKAFAEGTRNYAYAAGSGTLAETAAKSLDNTVVVNGDSSHAATLGAANTIRINGANNVGSIGVVSRSADTEFPTGSALFINGTRNVVLLYASTGVGSRVTLTVNRDDYQHPLLLVPNDTTHCIG